MELFLLMLKSVFLLFRKYLVFGLQMSRVFFSIFIYNLFHDVRDVENCIFPDISGECHGLVFCKEY